MATAARPLAFRDLPEEGEDPRDLTLLELVRAVGEVTENEREIVATVLHLLRSGRVRLRGNFRGAPLAVFRQ
jgi:hypothetical protein